MRQTIIDAFHETRLLTRPDIFDDDRLTPLTAALDAATAAPGWVGPDWAPGGTLMAAINPGGGGDTYRGNPTDDLLYGKIRSFRDAAVGDRAAALRDLSATWIQIQATHNIQRVVDAVLEATGSATSRAAFLNVLPFRTRGDRLPRSAELRRAWQKATAGQVESLAPGG